MKQILNLILLFSISILMLNTSSYIIVPVLGAEYDNIDSFNINPLHRWDLELNETSTLTYTQSGMLDLDDSAGDGSAGESFLYTRALSKTDVKTEARIKVPINYGYSGSPSWEFIFGIHGIDSNPSDTNKIDCGILLEGNLTDYTNGEVRLYFYYNEGDGSSRQKLYITTLNELEYLRFEIEIDILKSKLEYKALYDNGTKIAEKNYRDINNDVIFTSPYIFQRTGLKYAFGSYHVTGSSELYTSVDFIKAPYEEFRFNHYSGTEFISGDILNTNEYGSYGFVNSSYTHTTYYRNTVPEFDSVSTTLGYSWDATSSTSVDDLELAVYIKLYNVDEITGSLTTVVEGQLESSLSQPRIRLDDTIGGIDKFFTYTGTYSQKTSASFSFYRNPEGTKMICHANLNGFSISSSYNITGYSSEYVVELIHYASGVGAATDNSDYSTSITDFDLVYRDILGFLPDLGDVLDIDSVTKTIMTPILTGMRFIAETISLVFNVVMSPINTILGTIANLVSPLSGLLNSVISGITSLASGIWDQFSSILGSIETIIDDVLTAVNGLATGIIDLLVATVSDIIDEVLLLASDIITAFINAALLLGETLATLIGNIFDWLWTNFGEALFSGITSIILLFFDWFNVAISWWDTIYTFITEYKFALFSLVFIIFIIGTIHEDTRDVIDWVFNMAIESAKDVTGGIALLGFRAYIPFGFIIFLGLYYFWSGGT